MPQPPATAPPEKSGAPRTGNAPHTELRTWREDEPESADTQEGRGPDLLDYQESAAEWMSRQRRGMVVAPAGAGKTVVVAAALHRAVFRVHRERKVRVGWIAATIEQCGQGRAAIDKFPGLADAIELTICCPTGAPESWDPDVLIVDECHHAPAATWLTIVSAHQGCRWFITATPDGDDAERNKALRALVDGQVYDVPRAAVAERVLPARVLMLDATDANLRARIDAKIEATMRARRQYDRRTPEGELYAQVASHAAVSLGIIPNRARNAEIIRLAHDHRDDSVLVLVPTIDHGRKLSQSVPGSVLCHADMGVKNRRAAIEAFRAGELRCMFATSLADEGLDVPCASVLIMAGAGRSASKVEQRTGRVLRTHGDKTRGLIYDFTDLQHPLLARQSERRQEVYRRLGYDVQRAQPSLPILSR